LISGKLPQSFTISITGHLSNDFGRGFGMIFLIALDVGEQVLNVFFGVVDASGEKANRIVDFARYTRY
jgi:hypothetical protein